MPVTEKTRPNPYLKTPLRDLKINKDLTLTMINPAFMTRQISEIAAHSQGIKFHITSLTPLRPGNRPNQREKAALESFEKGTKEVGEFIRLDGKKRFFYMAPLITSKDCLRCHYEQGYREGDIRGGISVILPFVPHFPMMVLVVGHLIIGLAGVAGINYLGCRLNAAYGMIQYQASMDSLTGIPNRRSFRATLEHEYARAKRERAPLSLIMCDIDNFKGYNDTYGHNVGDECLAAVAQTIKSALKRPGDYCARYGGEEFIIILPGTNQKGSVQVAERLRLDLEQKAIPHQASFPKKVVTMSLGSVTMLPGGEVSQDELIERADRALYAAKGKGKNRVETYPAAKP